MTLEFLDRSRDPLRVVDDDETLAECLRALEGATGPVAFDAERAHGHRYWPKAYLFQIRREDAGTWLIDPLAFERDGVADLGRLIDACGDATWIIHAASQDLPCMRDAGIYPDKLFDTELGARLLGEPSVSLGALLEAKLGILLRKAHSADNWATRPLPESWLTYAALDVDYLIELHDVIRSELAARSRLDWALQEFDAVLQQFRVAPTPRPEPWRRLSGITSLRLPRQLALARALWEERDRIARERDRPPGRLVADSGVVEIASKVKANGALPSVGVLSEVRAFRTRSAQRYRTNWLRAIAAVADLPESRYPSRRPEFSGLPHPRNWERSNPAAYALWHRVRPEVDELACDLGIQPSLLAPPAILQRVIHDHAGLTDFTETLVSAGARPWQVEFLAPLLADVAQAS